VAQTLRRRDIFSIPLALACPPLAAVASPISISTRYRIDATIAPFGFTVFSRKEVGFGFARLRVQKEIGNSVTSFEFGGASIPDRTHGIHQIGYFEEELAEVQTKFHSSRYFGFISNTPEGAPNPETLALATDSSTKPQYCCAVEGVITDGQASFSKTYEAPLPKDASLASLGGLRQLMRSALSRICATSCLQGSRTATPSHSFLSVLAQSAFGASSILNTTYQYGDRVLSFSSNRQHVSGKLILHAEVQGKSRHRFSFTCLDSGHFELPLRIDYHPKAWLRLTLVAVPEPAAHKETA
jgi:hypothetical protein